MNPRCSRTRRSLVATPSRAAPIVVASSPLRPPIARPRPGNSNKRCRWYSARTNPCRNEPESPLVTSEAKIPPPLEQHPLSHGGGRGAVSRKPRRRRSSHGPAGTDRRPQHRPAAPHGRRVGLHRAVHARLRRSRAAASRAAAGLSGAQGQRTRRDRRRPPAGWRWSRASAPCWRWSPIRSSAGSATAPPHVWGMRRPWMLVGLACGCLGILTVAVAPNIAVVLLGWCIAQVSFNALLAALTAVMPDQVPTQQRGVVSGILAICLPVASVAGTFLVQLFDQARAHHAAGARARSVASSSWCSQPGSTTAGSTPRTRTPGRCASSSRRSTSTHAPAPTSPGRSPAGSCWSWPTPSSSPTRPTTSSSRSAPARTQVPHQIYLGTLAPVRRAHRHRPAHRQALGPPGRRKPFVLLAAVIYGVALFVIAGATDVDTYLVGMAIGGLGFGMYMAVDLALVVDVLPDPDHAAQGPRRPQHRRRTPVLPRPRHRARDPRPR